MARAFDGTYVLGKLPPMKCGGVPMWDYESECSYRCDSCFATIGSAGTPRSCVELNKEDENNDS